MEITNLSRVITHAEGAGQKERRMKKETEDDEEEETKEVVFEDELKTNTLNM